ncbi:hypothetical protein C6499_03985 [Candidatus Poribacteria bacterium]|nr:MAG: hypothetical protein C6499_03985 [Candidatus Poribacteria bacterium]
MPWIKIDISSLDLDPIISPPKESLTISGFHIATPYAFFVALMLILGCLPMLKRPWKARKLVLTCSVIGFLFVLITLFLFIPELSENTPLAEKILEYATSKVELGQIASLQFGGFGAALGFIVAFIGAWSLPKSAPSTENSE